LGQGARLPMVEQGLEGLFPGLQGHSYQITSPKSDDYNCIAWAAGDTRNWWWPDEDGQDTWPEDVSRTESVTAFVDAFVSLGYAVCDHADLEEGFDKIALFAIAEDRPKHAARQLPNGRWTSKLGHLEDIEHQLENLVGNEYGTVVRLMKRPVTNVAKE
jgi:hypothetical protein